MSIVVSSTTDTQEQVNAAAGIEPEAVTEEAATQTPAPAEQPPAEEPYPPDEDGDEDEEEEEEKKEVPPAPPKKRGGYLRKIEALERERGYSQRRIEELESVLAGQRKPAGQTQPEGPKPKPTQDQFQSYEEFIEALTDHKMEQRELALAQKAREWQAQEQERQRLNGWQSRVGEFKQTAADFDDMLQSVDHIQIPPALQQALMESETGPQLAYALAKDPKELERIAKLPPLAAIRALGAFEAHIANGNGNGTAPKAKETAPPPVPVSKAPPPVRPVATGSSSMTTRKPVEEMTYQEYKRHREAEIAAQKRR